MPILTRYWFEFDEADLIEWRDGWPTHGRFGYLPSPGCGITAYDYEDALRLLRRWILREDGFPKLSKVIKDVDVSTLYDCYGLHNSGCPAWRGIWYPSLNIFYGPDLEP